uniref:Uncharacterized protein n=1 Tax=Schistocephalus solidus TaxID=70667 RepID=A0A0X3Q4C5_SCHSO
MANAKYITWTKYLWASYHKLTKVAGISVSLYLGLDLIPWADSPGLASGHCCLVQQRTVLRTIKPHPSGTFAVLLLIGTWIDDCGVLSKLTISTLRTIIPSVGLRVTDKMEKNRIS